MKIMFKKIGKILLVLLCLLLLFMLVVFIYHRIMLSKEKKLISEPLGEMIEVDGGQMCVYTEGSGEHTLVFMSGYGTPSPILDFRPVYNRLADDFRIVVVEKFGYGFSDETDNPRDIDTMLRQTREAIAGAGIDGQFILCPHSASGLEALRWMQKYPEELEGIVALDMTMPGYHDETGYSIYQDRAVGFITNSGLLRLFSDSFPYAYNSDYLTDEEKAQYKALTYKRRGSATMIHEAEWCQRNVETIASGDAPTVPMLFILSRPMAESTFPSNPQKYLDLPRNYTGNQAEYIETDLGHYFYVEDPEFTVSEIRRFAEGLDIE
ncbi:MAG: alpha/beta hydrolase [Ruminococcus sp.]|nr:alpha/beta hydrolase [Ruminococcus sp.]